MEAHVAIPHLDATGGREEGKVVAWRQGTRERGEGTRAWGQRKGYSGRRWGKGKGGRRTKEKKWKVEVEDKGSGVEGRGEEAEICGGLRRRGKGQGAEQAKQGAWRKAASGRVVEASRRGRTLSRNRSDMQAAAV